MHTLAKAYKKKHPNAKYSTALKEAGRKVRGGKVSGIGHKKKRIVYEGYYKSPSTGKWAWRVISRKGYDQYRRIDPGRVRVRGSDGGKVGAHYKVYHEVRKVGAMGVPMPSPSQLEKQLEERLAWELLARETAKNATARKAAAKQIKSTKTALRAVSGLKRK